MPIATNHRGFALEKERAESNRIVSPYFGYFQRMRSDCGFSHIRDLNPCSDPKDALPAYLSHHKATESEHQLNKFFNLSLVVPVDGLA